MNANSEILCRLAGVVVSCAITTSVVASQQTFTYDPAGRLVAADYGTGKSISYAFDNAGNLIQSSQPSPAVLITSLVGNQLTLAWPVSPAGFVLQTAPALNPSTIWSNVNLTPDQVGNFYTVTLTVTSGGFYRLKKP